MTSTASTATSPEREQHDSGPDDGTHDVATPALMWRGDLRSTMASRRGKPISGWAARDNGAPTDQIAAVLTAVAGAEPCRVDVTSRAEAVACPDTTVPDTWMGRVHLVWPDGRNGTLDCWSSTVGDMIEADRAEAERREHNRQVRAHNKQMREAVRKGGFMTWAASRGL